jgi:hypothetical protein
MTAAASTSSSHNNVVGNRVPSINLSAEDNSGSQPSGEPNRLVDQSTAA